MIVQALKQKKMKRSQVIDKLMDHGISTIPSDITKKELPRVNSHIQGSSLYFNAVTNEELIDIWNSTFLETIIIEND